MENTPAWMQDVVEIPLKQAYPELGEVQEFRNKKLIMNHDRSKLYDVVSDRYQVLKHPEVVSIIQESLLDQFGNIHTKIESFNDGGRIRAIFTLKDVEPIEVRPGDLVEMKLHLYNSYDRVWSFRVNLGAFRLVCTNGATIGTSFGKFLTKHAGHLADIENVKANLKGMVDNSARLKEIWREWQDTPVHKSEAEAMVIAGNFPTKYAESMLQARFPMNKWDWWNQLTAVSTHQVQSAQRRIEFDETISRLFYGNI